MTTVELLLDRLSRSADGAYRAAEGSYLLEAVTGRPGSVCFRLEEVAQGVRVGLAEGFSHRGQIVYDQRALPEREIERILRRLAGEPAIPPERETTMAGGRLAGAA